MTPQLLPLVFTTLVATSGLVTGSNLGEIACIQQITNKLYVEPLHLPTAFLRIETERFAVGREPRAYVVHVYANGQMNAPEILSVDVVTVGEYLQYISARGPALRAATGNDRLREQRVLAAIEILRQIGGFDTDGKQRPSLRAGFVEVWFSHPTPPPYLSSRTMAVFDRTSGLLRMFGTPAIPSGE